MNCPDRMDGLRNGLQALEKARLPTLAGSVEAPHPKAGKPALDAVPGLLLRGDGARKVWVLRFAFNGRCSRRVHRAVTG